MTAKDFRIGDLVWAKMKGFPSWPAKISKPKKSPKKFHHYVYFFGTKDYAWILDEHITPHSESMLANLSNKKMTATLKAAVDEITEAVKEFDTRNEGESLELNVKKEVEEVAEAPRTKTKLAMKKESKKQFKAPKKRFLGNEHSSPSSSIAFSSLPSSSKEQKPKAVISPYDDDPQMDEDIKPFVSVMRHVLPTEKKLGFLGLGMMGQNIVRNLLRSGHKVTVWNRSPDKCDEFVKAGALKAATPADVMSACDITFCCVSDPDASKYVVFGPAGILRGLEMARRSTGPSKGYVELTSLDEQTSQEIGEAVQCEGGRYLEAQLGFSTRQLAQDGCLVVLGSGNLQLFRECETCFHAISKNAYFMGANVGQACKISIITSALAGTMSAAIGEALVLADRVGLPKSDLLEVAKVVGFECSQVEEKLLDYNIRPPPTVSLKNQQKDMFHMMRLSDSKDLPMPVIAAANEMFMHARRLGFHNRDSSAIYQATKF